MKKLLSILLACVMLLGLIAPVFAEDGEQPATDPAAVTDPVDDPTEDPATDSADVTDPTDDPADVTDPAYDPENPTEDPADDPADVTDPVDPDDPTDDPTNPADPTDPSDPEDPADPEDPNAEMDLEDIDDERSDAGETTYALWDENTKTLTLYYGTLPATYAVKGFGSDKSAPFASYTTATKVVFDPSFANARPTSLYCFFQKFKSLLSIEGFEFLNTSQVTDMGWMFEECRSITRLDVSHFDTSNVADMTAMFQFCTQLASLDLSNFNTGNATSIGSMFAECNSLQSLNVTSFNTSKVQNMHGTFGGCSSLKSLDVSNFDTNNVTSMAYMFAGSAWGGGPSILTSLDLSSFNTRNVSYMFNMFWNCNQLETIIVDGSKWSTAAVTWDSDMFTGCNALVGGNGTTYNASVVDKTYACVDKAGTPGYLTDISAMPEKTTYALWDESTKTLKLAYGVAPSDAAVTGFGFLTDYDYNYSGPFSEYRSATKVVIDPSFAKARPTTLACLFYEFSSLESIAGVEYINTSNVTDMNTMFGGCESLTSLDVSSFDTSNVTKMGAMFVCCRKLTSLDLSTFNTSNVTSMHAMFQSCNSLTSLDLSNFDTSNVTDMSFMFIVCNELSLLDISGFDTRNVTGMILLFHGCVKLHTVYVDKDKWSTASVTDDTRMFENCTSLVGGKGTVIGETIDMTMAHIDEVGNPGYLTDIADKPRLNLGTSETQKQFYVEEIVTQPDGVVYAKLPKNSYPRFSTTNYPTLVGNQYAGKYVFAGYYDSVGEGATTERTATETTGYARFIPIEVLDVYVQFRHTSLAASDPQNKTDLRFLTSVPDPATLGYNGQIVGFRLVNLANGKVISDAAFGAEYCYDEIIGDYKVQTGSGLVSLTPDKFYSGVSKKVALQTVIGMPNSYFENQKRLSVQPYIITLDGTKSHATVHPFMLKIVNGKKTAAPIANN